MVMFGILVSMATPESCWMMSLPLFQKHTCFLTQREDAVVLIVLYVYTKENMRVVSLSEGLNIIGSEYVVL